MSKWSEEFVRTYSGTKRVRKLTKEYEKDNVARAERIKKMLKRFNKGG
jgi:hypothetical protein|tara:strand:- start:2580 stop:2723 length:144 start_codon:yes stop_codon:yes gene_type:complete